MQINPYLNFNGNGHEAFLYYQKIFGGEIKLYSQFKDMPDFKINPNYKNKDNYYVHGELITKDFTIYFSDSYKDVTFGNSIYMSLQITSLDEINKIYDYFKDEAISIGMPIDDTFWGSRYASFTDKFGIKWVLNYQY